MSDVGLFLPYLRGGAEGVIVNLARALAVSLVLGIDLSLIQMVRDGRGAIGFRMNSSWKNERAGIERELRSWPAWCLSFDWVCGNYLSELISRYSATPTLRIRYEDSVKSPRTPLM